MTFGSLDDIETGEQIGMGSVGSFEICAIQGTQNHVSEFSQTPSVATMLLTEGEAV